MKDDRSIQDIKRLEDLPPVLSPLEVATVLKITRQQVYKLIAGGYLRAVDVLGQKTGGRRPSWRVLREDLISYLHGDTAQGPARDSAKAA